MEKLISHLQPALRYKLALASAGGAPAEMAAVAFGTNSRYPFFGYKYPAILLY